MIPLCTLKPASKDNYIRTDEVVRQIIRYRFLDPKVSAEVIAQRLIQSGHNISVRSVKHDTIIVTYYNAPNPGLMKKHYANLPAKLIAEGVKPTIPWLRDFKLDFRFK